MTGCAMNKVKLDAGLAANLTAPAELTDEAGRTIGFVITPGEYEEVRKKLEKRRRVYEHVRTLFTDEDVAAADAAGGEFTYEEVMEYLRQLERPDRAKSA